MAFKNYSAQHDPGLVRTRESIKLVLTALIAGGLVSGHSPLVIFYSGFIGSCLSLFVSGKNRRHLAYFIMLAGIVFVICFCLGALLRPYSLPANIVLVILSFLVFYVRRFGIYFMAWPIFAAVLALVAVYLPYSLSLSDILLSGTVGTLVALIIGTLFYVKPSRHFYQDHIIGFCLLYQRLLLYIRAFLKGHRELDKTRHKLRHHGMWAIKKLTALGLNHDQLFVEIYALKEVIFMFWEAIVQLEQKHPETFNTLKLPLNELCKTICHELGRITQNHYREHYRTIDHEFAATILAKLSLPDQADLVHLNNLRFAIWRIFDLVLSIEKLKEQL